MEIVVVGKKKKKPTKELAVVIRKFNKGCVDYNLLEDGDRILIAVSGGKDSLLLTKLLAERARIFRPSIHVEAAHVVMDNVPYETDRSYLHQFCNDLGVPLHILHSRFDSTVDPRKTRCFLCAWHRRKALFAFAAEHGFNKVALGHHQDDILITWLMNISFEGSSLPVMPPRLKLEHYPLDIIRPLCLVFERDIASAAQRLDFVKQKVACPYEETTRRSEVSAIFNQLERLNPEVRYSMWKAMGVSSQNQ